MKKFSLLITLGVTLPLALLLMGSPPSYSAQTTKMLKRPVFANYMVCFAAYGVNMEGFKREIREAQAAGIDGFALNEGAWHDEPMYVQRTQMLFQAAKELGTNFQFIFSLDLATLKPGYILEILKTYVTHPNYYQYQGRPLVTTFMGELGVDWQNIRKQLKADGLDMCFVPFFYPRPNVTELPDYAAVKEHFAKWNSTVDGYFFFGAAGTAEQLTASNAAYIKVAREDHKLVMSSFTPFYWGKSNLDEGILKRAAVSGWRNNGNRSLRTNRISCRLSPGMTSANRISVRWITWERISIIWHPPFTLFVTLTPDTLNCVSTSFNGTRRVNNQRLPKTGSFISIAHIPRRR